MKERVYVAGPYTVGDTAVNVRNAIEAGNWLMSAGYSPFIPHLSHFQHLLFPRPYTDWTENDMAWLPACDRIVRLPGKSKGADAEVAWAKRNGMSVYSLEELLADPPEGANP